VGLFITEQESEGGNRMGDLKSVYIQQRIRNRGGKKMGESRWEVQRKSPAGSSHCAGALKSMGGKQKWIRRNVKLGGKSGTKPNKTK